MYEAIMTQYIYQSGRNQRCIPCEMEAEFEIEKRKKNKAKRKIGLAEYIGLLTD